MFGRMMGGLLGNQPSMGYGQPQLNWWEQSNLPGYQEQQAPHFYQAPPVNQFMPRPSPYGFMPQMQQPIGFQPTKVALPIMTPEKNNPADPLLNAGGGGGGVGAAPQQQADLAAAMEAMREAQKRANNLNIQMIGHDPAPAGSLWGGPTRRANNRASQAKTDYEKALYDAVMAGYQP